eukprot:1150188-Pelagomonas_calceolata.AAC.3
MSILLSMPTNLYPLGVLLITRILLSARFRKRGLPVIVQILISPFVLYLVLWAERTACGVCAHVCFVGATPVSVNPPVAERGTLLLSWQARS